MIFTACPLSWRASADIAENEVPCPSQTFVHPLDDRITEPDFPYVEPHIVPCAAELASQALRFGVVGFAVTDENVGH
jgi:hypothetical protein